MDRDRRISMYLGTMTLLLGIQFLLGMYINLFLSLPTGTQDFATYLTYSPVLAVHIVVALIAIVVNFMALFTAIHAKIGNLSVLAILLSLVSIVIAGISGMLFLMAGGNVYSYLMAVFFISSFAFIGFAMSGVRKAKN